MEINNYLLLTIIPKVKQPLNTYIGAACISYAQTLQNAFYEMN